MKPKPKKKGPARDKHGRFIAKPQASPKAKKRIAVSRRITRPMVDVPHQPKKFSKPTSKPAPSRIRTPSKTKHRIPPKDKKSRKKIRKAVEPIRRKRLVKPPPAVHKKKKRIRSLLDKYPELDYLDEIEDELEGELEWYEKP